MLKSMLTDGRNPGAITKADRQRYADRAGVSPAWNRNPYGISPVQVLPLIQPGVFRVDGIPVRQENPWNAELGAMADANGWNLLGPDGKDILLWHRTYRRADGTTATETTTALDLTNKDARDMFAGELPNYYQWAHGMWFDYFGSFDNGSALGPAFWPKWFDGWRDVCERVRKARPDWFLLGQSYQLSTITDCVDGIFIEEHPQHFGVLLADQGKMLDRYGAKAQDCVFEIRSGWNIPPDLVGKVTPESWQAYVRQCLAFIERRGCYVSFGRDQSAGAGLPS